MKHSLKRWTALLLALVMVAGLLPSVAPTAAAQQDPVGTLDHTDVITLPVTIRNHATDGMLFEWDGIGSGSENSGEYTYKPYRNPYNTSDITEPIPYIGVNLAVGQFFCNDWDVSNLNKDGIEYHYGETYDSRYARIQHYGGGQNNGWREHNIWDREITFDANDHDDTQFMVIRFRTLGDFENDLLFIKRYTDGSFTQSGIDLHTSSANGPDGPYKLVGTEDGWTTIAVDLNNSSLWTDTQHAWKPGGRVTRISLGFSGSHTIDISYIAFFPRLNNNGNYANSFRYCGYDFINQDYCFRMDDPNITMVEPMPTVGMNVLVSRTDVSMLSDGDYVTSHITANADPEYDYDKYVQINAGTTSVWTAADLSKIRNDAARYVAIRCNDVNADLVIHAVKDADGSDRTVTFNPYSGSVTGAALMESRTETDTLHGVTWKTYVFDLGKPNFKPRSLSLEVPSGKSVKLAYLGAFSQYEETATSGYNYATDARVFVFEDYSYRHDRASYNTEVEHYKVYRDSGSNVVHFQTSSGAAFDPTAVVNIEHAFDIGGTRVSSFTADNGTVAEINDETGHYLKLTDTGNDRGIGARAVLMNGVNKQANQLRYAVVSYCVQDKGSASGDTVPMYVMLDTADSGFNYETVTLGFFDAVADGRWHVDTLDLSECVSRAPNGETYMYKHDTFKNNGTTNISRIGIADGWGVYGLELRLAYIALFPTATMAEQYGNAYSEAYKRFPNEIPTTAQDYSVITNAFTAVEGQIRDDSSLVKHLDGNENNWNSNNLEYWEDANGNKRFRVGSNNGFELIDPDYAYLENSNYYKETVDGHSLPNYYLDKGFGEYVKGDSSYTNYNANGDTIAYYNDSNVRTMKIEGESGIWGESTATYGYMMGHTARTLTEDGRIEYRQEVVEYLAQLLKKALNVPRTFMWYDIQFYSANYVQGDVDGERFGYYDEVVDGEENVNAMFPRDYAGWLRYKLGVTNQDGSLTGNPGELGDWNTTKAKGAALLADRENIASWTDAAYYMLNTLFLDSAGVDVPEYKYLQLTRETPDGSKAGEEESYYVFDTSYTNVMFDFDKGVISNNSPYVDTDISKKDTTDGHIATYAFLPILRELPEFQSTFPYLKDTGIANKDDGADSYYNRDYNFTLECHGTFTYYAEKNLFFQFEGDDDVYLYVDGRCVLDLGGGHRAANQKIYLNDYVNAGLLDLQDDQDYTFDFYFMERHGTGSNLRIQTNMEVYSDNIETHKSAEQDGVELADYSIADFTQPVSYSFSVTNNFDPLGKLFNFSFKDSDIDFYAGFDMMDDEHLAESQLTELTVSVTDSGGNVVYSEQPENLVELRRMLTDPGDRGGLGYNETVTLSGVKYTIGSEVSAFSNTVISRAGKHSGVAYHHLLNNDSAVHFYAWRGKTLEIPISEILKHKGAGDTSSWSDIYRCDPASMKALNTSEVTLVKENGVAKAVRVKYDAVGTRRLAFTSDTIPQEIGQYPIQVDVHVLDTADSVYVLDFDGMVKLGDGSDYSIAANDVTALSGVSTKVRYEAVTDEAPVYTDNRLTFKDSLWPKEPGEEPPAPEQHTLTVTLGSGMSASGGSLSQTLDEGNTITPITVSPADPVQNVINAPSITGSNVTASFQPAEDVLFINMSSTGMDWLGDNAVQHIYFFTDGNQDCWRYPHKVDTYNGNTIYAVRVPKDGNGNYYKKLVVVRKDPGVTIGDNWDGKWNQSADISIVGFGAQKNYVSSFTSNSSTFNSAYSGPASGKLGSWQLTGTLDTDVTVSFANTVAPAAAAAPATVRDGETVNLVQAPYYYKNGNPVETVPDAGVAFANDQGSFTAKLLDGDGLPLLNFTPGGILDGPATIWITSRVYEDGAEGAPGAYLGNVDITKEVEMFQAVTVVPANVVYYEDVNAGIHFNTDALETQPVVTWTDDTSASPEQSATQTGPYGYDAAYGGCKGYSGNSETEIQFKGNVTLADFDFTGTGFDLFSRCQKEGPTLVLRIYNASPESSHNYAGDTPVKTVYVATEFTNYTTGQNDSDAMYQVPVTSVHGLERGKYHVILDGAGRVDMSNWNIIQENGNYYMVHKTNGERWQILLPEHSGDPIRYQQEGGDPTTLNPASVTMTFWLDGLRVYGALSETDQETYYNPGEANASFIEVRDLLTSGRGVAVNYTENITDFSTEGFATTVELHNEPSEGFPLDDNSGADLSYYFLVGPNNELYLKGDSSKLQAAVFNLVPEGSGAKTFQIAAKLLDSASFGNSGSSTGLRYMTAAGAWKELTRVGSGTELYYELDPTLCPQSDGSFLVIVAPGGGQNDSAMLSLTKVKYKGWSFRQDYSTKTNFITDESGLIIGIQSEGSKRLGNIIRLIAGDPQSLPRPLRPFTDVADGAWYAEAVDWALANGITAGTSATTFSPNAGCTRAQVVTFLWNAAGKPEPTGTASFADVPAEAWYAKAVAWALENGVTAGTSASEFSPNAVCTRAQVVTFLWRSAGSPQTGSAAFADVAPGAWYAKAVGWAVEQGITAGTSAETFSPNRTCTRAQIVTFLYRHAETE